MSPALTKAAVTAAIQSALDECTDGQGEAHRRSTYAQRRGAGGQPANINLVASTSTGPPAGGSPTSPQAGVRRRSLFADADAWHTPEVLSPPSAPLTPTTDSSTHLQQARAAVALAQIGGEVSEAWKGSLPPARSHCMTGRPSAAARAVGSILVAPFRTARASASHASSSDPLLAIQPSDLRRPSFQITDASTLPSGRRSPKPAHPPGTSGAATARRLSIFRAAGRRAQRTLRAYLLLLLAVISLLKVTGRLPSVAKLYPLNTPNVNAPHKASQAVPRPSEEALLRVDPLQGANPSPPPILHGSTELDPMFIHEEPAAGADDVPVRMGTSGDRVHPSPSASPAPTSPADRLVLSPAELAAMREKRAEKLWAAPEKEVRIEAEDARKGHLHETTIIFLHGLGQVKNDAFMPAFLHKRFPTTRWVVPLADRRPVGVSEEASTAWYNIDQFPYDYERDQDVEDMYATARRINRVIVDERARLIRNLRRRGGGAGHGEANPEEAVGGLDEFGTKAEREWASRRIVLAGFSQGAVMTLLVGLTHPERLGALVVFSGYLPLRDEMAKYVYDLDRRDLPLFWGHGTADQFLLFRDAVESLALLAPAAVPDTFWNDGTIPPSALAHAHPSYRLNLTSVAFRSYDGVGHTFCLPELSAVDTWLRAQLPEGSQRGERLPGIGEGMALR
ncbi:hypothetical protein JCM3770_000292 [Rhodotorula araucariae]